MTLDLKDRLYTSSEVAEILGVSLRSVYRYLEEGKIDADIKTATGRHRFSKKNILDFLQPGGVSKEVPVVSIEDEDEEDFDVLDLPAISKSRKDSDTADDFSFDLDEDFFKSLDFASDSSLGQSKDGETSLNKEPRLQNGDYLDDDLERLLREFEEKESVSLNMRDSGVGISSSEDNLISEKLQPTSINKEDESEFDLDSFFKELEDDKADLEKSSDTSDKKNEDFDFDFDFDTDFLNDSLQDKTTVKKEEPELEIVDNNHNNSISKSTKLEANSNLLDEEDNEDNWLERFRKAAQKNSSTDYQESTNKEEDILKDTFFDNSNLDHFFGPKDSISSISPTSLENNTKSEKTTPRSSGNKEYYYTSTLSGLKEIAQNIDKIAKKFDTDYAFTLNAGLSLHKPIAPFTLIHTYVRDRDLELFEDYLNLTQVDTITDSSVCLIVPSDPSLFEDSYELHGLYVVSNVQLRSDLIDHGLDKLAREI
jgi:excisionase family DNA binding protein